MAILNVPVTKAKGTVEIDLDTIPEEVYKEALLQGLKVLVNRGASKISKVTYPVEAELKTAALAKAQEQVEAIKAGKIKITGQKKVAGVTGAVTTEARRLARNLVKDEMKRQGIKISHVEASEITKAANELLAADTKPHEDGTPNLYEQAKANLEARAKVSVSSKINIKALIHESPELVAKAEARKAKKDGTLSAKQAGKVKTRAKGQSAPANA